MAKINAKILKLIQKAAAATKAEQAAKAAYETAKEKRVTVVTELAEAGAVKGMEQVTKNVTRIVSEQVNVNVPYGDIVKQLKQEYPVIADRADELIEEGRTRSVKLKVRELETK